MKMHILTAILLLCTAVTGNATVLDFEGFSNASRLNVYGGLRWDNVYVLDTTSNNLINGYRNGLVSGSNVAFNGFGMSASVSNGIFDFNGAYFTGVFNNGLTIDVQGWNNNQLLYDTSVVVDTIQPTYFNFDFQGINTIFFTSHGGTSAGYPGSGTQFAMDNFTFNEPIPAPAPVPEPCTMMLLGIGMAGLAIYGKRRADNSEA